MYNYLGFWETDHHKLILTLTSHSWQNVGLWKGWVGSFPETPFDPKGFVGMMGLKNPTWVSL